METVHTLENVILNQSLANEAARKQQTTGFHHGVDAGNYNCEIVDASVRAHPEKKHTIVKVEMKVLDGADSGHKLNKYYNLTSKDAVKFFKREMAEIGKEITDPKDLSELPAVLPNTTVIAKVDDHLSGNQVIYLKRPAVPKKLTAPDPNSFWN